MNIRVVLADDFPSVLAKVSRILEQSCEIVAAVRNGEEALDAVRRLDPDVLVIDISMPGLDGLRTAAILQEAGHRVKIVFLTIHEDQDFSRAAFAAGASGYVTKSHLATDLVPAIRDAVQGDIYVSPSLHLPEIG